ncbi:MAG: GGDEF domain-containing protein [Phycisphaerae bacterium]
MSRHNDRYSLKLVAPAGVMLLAASHLLSFNGSAAKNSYMETVGIAVGYGIVAVGMYFHFSTSNARVERLSAHLPPPTALPAAPIALAPAMPLAPLRARDAAPHEPLAHRMLAEFDEWLVAHGDDESLWTAFDQRVREALNEHLGAARVRCFRCPPDGAALRPLTRGGGSAAILAANDMPLLGHVASTGNAFVSAEGQSGPMVEELAKNDRERWDWVWRIHDAGAPLGVIAVAMPDGRQLPERSVRGVIARLVDLQWRHVAALDQLRLVSRTDKSSGVMARSDFFEAAEQAAARAGTEHEPVVAATLVIEGLRRLDDEGKWRERDALVPQIGQAISHRTRRDDVVGRFSDDRFVILLRRMDIALGKLVAEKIRAAAEAAASGVLGPAHTLAFRVGLAGGSVEPQPLRGLLLSAFQAADQARREKLTLCVRSQETAAEPAA